ncbi:ADP-ribosylation factor-like 10 [Gouania willdenowi]|uniref:ADP-ribosylation factor-like 10 n=1 Tax=Gouania willdenowi TaxID=441366 RepID=UPI001056A468|nr:ADP-ribosylation factor-like protein 9 [Gouania willdenowi]
MDLLRKISEAVGAAVAMLGAAVAMLGAALFITLSSFYRRRPHRYVFITQEQDQGGKAQLQVLVVGLDGAGKSSVLQALSCEGRSRRRKGRSFRPTRGFNFLSVHMPTCQLDFLEIGGAEDLRCHWSDYLRRSDLLLFVVDSSDKRRLPLAKAELHRLLRARPRLPTVVLGNKQDKVGRACVSELRRSLSLVDDRKLLLIPSHLDTDGFLRTSVHHHTDVLDVDRLQELLRCLRGHKHSF